MDTADVKLKSTLKLRHLRHLKVSAASGLLLLNDHFYMVADDEFSLLIFSQNQMDQEQKILLSDENLSLIPQIRKQEKPDFEALVFLPGLDSILILPSGSKPNRIRGALIRGSEVRPISLAGLYRHLVSLNPDLNIEGSVILGNELKLFHRGNGPSQQNLIFRLQLDLVLNEIEHQGAMSSQSFIGMDQCDLGFLQEQNLSFTDAAVESFDRIWYLAAAESGKSTYDDGKYLGSVIGCMNTQNRLLFQQELDCPQKPEGLALDLSEKKFYVVTDTDDRRQPAQLLEGDLPSLVEIN